MARRALKTINWAGLAELIPESEKNMLATLKSKTDQYLRKVNEFPESAPKIDWPQYKKVISVPGMVDSFQKHYESMQIPFPADNYTNLIEAEEKDMSAKVEDFKRQCDQAITNFKAEIEKINNTLPVEEMNMEEAVEAFPDFKPNTVDKPSIWPHSPEFQPEYIAKEKVESAH